VRSRRRSAKLRLVSTELLNVIDWNIASKVATGTVADLAVRVIEHVEAL
jgi:hypothetical protein